MMMYKYLLERSREAYMWSKRSDKISAEMDELLIILLIFMVVWFFISGADYWADGRKGMTVVHGVLIGVNMVNLVVTIFRMIRRRKSAKLSREFWETEIKRLEELVNEDAESEMDIP